MTYSDLTFYETEVIEVVDKVLDAVKAKNFENYILLIARGGYQYEIEKTFLSPYVISSRQEIYLDRTRDKFLVAYLNNYEIMYSKKKSKIKSKSNEINDENES